MNGVAGELQDYENRVEIDLWRLDITSMLGTVQQSVAMAHARHQDNRHSWF